MKLLGLDVGERRVGLAVSDATGLIATPLTTLQRTSWLEDFRRIARVAREQGAQGIVVGHPLNRDGSAGPQARSVERYAMALGRALRREGQGIPIVLWDEYLSTQQAEEALAGTARRSRARRAGIDAMAAAVILQEYLDAHRPAPQGRTEEETV